MKHSKINNNILLFDSSSVVRTISNIVIKVLTHRYRRLLTPLNALGCSDVSKALPRRLLIG